MKPRRLPPTKNVIYFLPNLFTTGNLFCGFYSVIASLQDLYIPAAIAIFAAGIFDTLDGRIARLVKRPSQFGLEYDSLSDLVSFGIAPAMLLYLWALESFGRIGWLACFVFLACGALRLARFNIKTTSLEKSFFQGLPIPMAAYAVATTLFIFTELMLEEEKNFFILGLPFILGSLMVSNIRYHSFKDLDLRNRRSFGLLVLALFILIVVAYNPGVMMFVVMMGYVLSGPIFHVIEGNSKSVKTSKTLDASHLRLLGKEEIPS